ncbi:glycosyltransferase [Mucilaginibacter lacusdianchii]|uniref:glycosyltransferase n=1 Tax=Mucilaginibacter lacusdianchii TaxID=2684211 RepID=UPI00131B6C58|nr:glycosyltransferase [Mucilaginibacter sp. JXJ CY 39]
MISIVVSSYKPQLLQNLKVNIEDTIGTAYELIVIENANAMSLTKAYNLGFQKSKYDIVAFIHEDLHIHTANWGQVVIQYFAQMPKLGCLGVAGSKYKTQAPSALWDNGVENRVIHILQHRTNNPSVMEHVGWQGEEKYTNVAAVDGVFICTNKANGLAFNEAIPGYHCYDLNIAFEAKVYQLDVVVTNEILIEHFSAGRIDNGWYAATDILHSKYQKTLPIRINTQSNAKIEHFNYYHYILGAYKAGLKNLSLRYWRIYFSRMPFSTNHLKLLKFFAMQSLK